MVLVDTSVWISHLRDGNSELENLLINAEVICHPFIVGELACGNIRNRTEILSLLHNLPIVDVIDHSEILFFIENNQLMGKGLGLIDIHLLASAILADSQLWTMDNNLEKLSSKLMVSYKI